MYFGGEKERTVTNLQNLSSIHNVDDNGTEKRQVTNLQNLSSIHNFNFDNTLP